MNCSTGFCWGGGGECVDTLIRHHHLQAVLGQAPPEKKRIIIIAASTLPTLLGISEISTLVDGPMNINAHFSKLLAVRWTSVHHKHY